MTIGIWGDSIVYGNNDLESLGWATTLRKYLVNKAEAEGEEWVNTYVFGICGQTSSDLLKRYPIELEGSQPNIVILGIGINDSAYRTNQDHLVSLDDFKENLKKMVELAQEYTTKIICIGLTRVNESEVSPYPFSSTGKGWKNNQIEAYDNALEELCNTLSIKYVKMSDVVLGEDLDDGLHPNTEGHKKMFKVIKRELDSLSGSNTD